MGFMSFRLARNLGRNSILAALNLLKLPNAASAGTFESHGLYGLMHNPCVNMANAQKPEYVDGRFLGEGGEPILPSCACSSLSKQGC